MESRDSLDMFAVQPRISLTLRSSDEMSSNVLSTLSLKRFKGVLGLDYYIRYI